MIELSTIQIGMFCLSLILVGIFLYKALKTPREQQFETARWMMEHKIPHLMTHKRWVEHAKKEKL